MISYVYIHSRPDGIPFYVGKGTMRRVNLFVRRGNPHYTNIVKKYGAENIRTCAFECASEEEAFSGEKHLIRQLRNEGYSLCNATDGGEGACGFRHTEAAKIKISAAVRGRRMPEDVKNKISGALSGKKKSDSTRQKMAIARTGKKVSEETRARMIASRRKRMVN